MKKNLSNILAVVVYGLSVYVSGRHAAQMWVVGPVFALAVLGVNAAQLKSTQALRYLFLMMASTLIYAGVFLLADRGWKFRNDWLDMLFGGLSAGVVLGSLLMPAVQAFLFGRDLKTVRQTSFSLILAWYLVILISGLEGALGLGLQIDYIFVSVALWQGIYLYRLRLE